MKMFYVGINRAGKVTHTYKLTADGVNRELPKARFMRNVSDPNLPPTLWMVVQAEEKDSAVDQAQRMGEVVRNKGPWGLVDPMVVLYGRKGGEDDNDASTEGG